YVGPDRSRLSKKLRVAYLDIERRLAGPALPAQRMQNQRSTDPKTHHGRKRHCFHPGQGYFQQVSAERDNRTQQAEDIEPKRRPDLGKVASEPQLEKKSRQSDGRNHHQRDRTKKGSLFRI